MTEDKNDLQKQLAEFDKLLADKFQAGQKDKDKYKVLQKQAEFRVADTSYLQDMQHELKLVRDKKIAPVLSKMNKSIQSQGHGLYQNMQNALGRGEFRDAKKVEDVEHLIFHGEKNTDTQKSAQPTKRHPVIKVLVDFFTKVANIAKKGERKGGMGALDKELESASKNLGEKMIKAGRNHRQQVERSRVSRGGRDYGV